MVLSSSDQQTVLQIEEWIKRIAPTTEEKNSKTDAFR